MNKNLIAIDPSFPQDSRAWPTQIKLHHISSLQTKQLSLSTTVLEAKGVIEIPNKVVNSKMKTNQKQPEKLHQITCFNRDHKVPKTYFGTE